MKQALVRNADVWHCPTILGWQLNALWTDSRVRQDPRLKYVPDSIKQVWAADGKAEPAENMRNYQKLFTAGLALTGELHRAGVQLLAGTDAAGDYTYPGFSLHEELALLVQAGSVTDGHL